jgi:hypothetical protein
MTKGAGDQAVAEPEPARRRRPAEPKAEGVVPEARSETPLKRERTGAKSASLAHRKAVKSEGASVTFDRGK